DHLRRSGLESRFEPFAQRRHAGARARKALAGCRCGSPKTGNARDVFRAAAQAALLAAALDEWIDRDRRAPNPRAYPLWRADLVPRQCEEISSEQVDITRDSTRRLDRVDVQGSTRCMDHTRGLRHRLDDTDLVIGEHERHQRPALARSHPPFERRKVDLTA